MTGSRKLNYHQDLVKDPYFPSPGPKKLYCKIYFQMSNMDNRVINILLVEDDKLDVIDMQRTLNKMNILHRTTVAKNGEEAIQQLSQWPGEKPDLVLLDINMPKMNGIEFLTTIRGTNEWKDLKVFVITTSD